MSFTLRVNIWQMLTSERFKRLGDFSMLHKPPRRLRAEVDLGTNNEW